MASETSSWSLACSIVRNHVPPGQSCEQAINRLWTKGVTDLRPWISRGAVDIYLEHWDLERLLSLVGTIDSIAVPAYPSGDPPVVVRWQGRDYRIDGRRRIAQWGRRGDRGPHAVLILDIGNVAGDI